MIVLSHSEENIGTIVAHMHEHDETKLRNIKPKLHCVFYIIIFALAIQPNATEMQILLPILHFVFSLKLDIFGVISKGYVNI